MKHGIHAFSQLVLWSLSESLRWHIAAGVLLLGAATVANAQTSAAESKPPTEFPPEAQPLAGQALEQRLTGKVYTAKVFTGVKWRLQFRGEYLYVNLSSGPNDTGRWRIDGTRMCVEYQNRFPSGCSEMRASPDRLYLKRASDGEVVELQPAS